MVTSIQDSEVQVLVTEAASIMQRKHDGYTDRDDLVQEGYLYLLEHPELLDEMSDGSKKAYNLAAKSVRWAMDRYGMKQRMLKDGTQRDDYFRYTAGMVEELLAEALEGIPYMKSPSAVDDAPSSGKSPSESGDRMAMAADIRQAFTRLRDKDQELLLEKFFGGDVSDEVLAITHEVTPNAIRMRVDRALVRLAKALNGDYSPKEKRRVVSNQTAQVWTNKWVEEK